MSAEILEVLLQAARQQADARVEQVQAMLAGVEAAAAQLAQEGVNKAQRGHQQLQAEVQRLVRQLDEARAGQQQAEVGVPNSFGLLWRHMVFQCHV